MKKYILLFLTNLVYIFFIGCEKNIEVDKNQEEVLEPYIEKVYTSNETEKDTIIVNAKKSATDTDFGSYDLNVSASPYGWTGMKMISGNIDSDGTDEMQFVYRYSLNSCLVIDNGTLNSLSDASEDFSYNMYDYSWYDNADMDGDGKEDNIRVKTNGYLSIDYYASGGGIGSWDYTHSGYGSPNDNAFDMADVDGDGKADIIKITSGGSLYFDYADDGFGSWDWNHSGYGDPADNTFIAADIDGDGEADLLKISDSGSIYIDYADDGFGSWDESHSGYGSQSSNTFRLADFDGDGEADLLKLTNSGSIYIDYADDGYGSWDESHSGYGDNRTRRLSCEDYDGDGKDDICTISGSLRIDYADD